MDNLKMSNPALTNNTAGTLGFARHHGRYSTVTVRTVILLVCAAQQRMKEGGVLPLPKVEMVKRKTDSCELLPDH